MTHAHMRARKREVRAQVTQLRSRLTPEERTDFSRRAVHALSEYAPFRNATTVALFHSMRDEIDTGGLLRMLWDRGTNVALPVTPKLGFPLGFRSVTPTSSMVTTRYGALEPAESEPAIEASSFDLIVVPGLAFDSCGRRLGYGGGYYDRTLAMAGDRVTSVMFCFSCQQVDAVPEESHDQRVDNVVTEDGVLF